MSTDSGGLSAAQVWASITRTLGSSMWNHTIIALSHGRMKALQPGTSYGALQGCASRERCFGASLQLSTCAQASTVSLTFAWLAAHCAALHHHAVSACLSQPARRDRHQEGPGA